MQAAGIQSLIALTVGAPSGPSVPSPTGEQSVSPFAQLLDAANPVDDNAQREPFARNPFLQSVALSALNAQGLDAQAVPRAVVALDQPIEAADVPAVIGQLQALLEKQPSAADRDALEYLVAKLSDIQNGAAPRSLGAIIEANPKLRAPSFLQTLRTQLVATGRAQPDELAVVPPSELLQLPAREVAPLDAAQERFAAQRRDGDDTVVPFVNDVARVTVIEPLAFVASSLPALPPAILADADESIDASESLAPQSADAALQALLERYGLPPIASAVAPSTDAKIPQPLPIQAADAAPIKPLPRELPIQAADAANTKPLPRELPAVAANPVVPVATVATEDKSLARRVEGLGEKNAASFEALVNPSHVNGFSPTQTTQAAQPVNVVSTHGYVNHAPVSEQVRVALRQATKEGIEQLTIQLDPLELGRIEVTIHTNREGLTQVAFLVDKSDTFDSLSRDARALERSLQEAGVKADTGSMQFNLRQQQPDSQGQRQPGAQHAASESGDSSRELSEISAPDARSRHYLFNIREGVDISA